MIKICLTELFENEHSCKNMNKRSKWSLIWPHNIHSILADVTLTAYDQEVFIDRNLHQTIIQKYSIT
jgi:hypothetical protein